MVKAPLLRPVGGLPPVLAPAGKTAVKPEAIKRFMAAPAGAVQVGLLPPPLMKVLKTKSPYLLISAETVRKQIANHTDLERDDRRCLHRRAESPSETKS